MPPTVSSGVYPRPLAGRRAPGVTGVGGSSHAPPRRLTSSRRWRRITGAVTRGHGTGHHAVRPTGATARATSTVTGHRRRRSHATATSTAGRGAGTGGGQGHRGATGTATARPSTGIESRRLTATYGGRRTVRKGHTTSRGAEDDDDARRSFVQNRRRVNAQRPLTASLS